MTKKTIFIIAIILLAICVIGYAVHGCNPATQTQEYHPGVPKKEMHPGKDDTTKTKKHKVLEAKKITLPDSTGKWEPVSYSDDDYSLRVEIARLGDSLIVRPVLDFYEKTIKRVDTLYITQVDTLIFHDKEPEHFYNAPWFRILEVSAAFIGGALTVIFLIN